MDKVAQMSSTDRRDLFRIAATRRGDMTAVLIEKDFWVCWLLQQLFNMSSHSSDLIFKGGTSLSKVFHAIDRFSEIVDVVNQLEQQINAMG